MNKLNTSLTLISVSVLSACANFSPLGERYKADTQETRTHFDSLVKNQRPQSAYTETTESPRISVRPLTQEQQSAIDKKWLTSIEHITLDPARNGSVPATAIIRMMRSKGINIVSHLPLDLYAYSGFGVTDVNAETALMVFMGAMGLDYELDNARRLVTIQPMKARTWQLDIGNRRTSFMAGDSNNGTSGSAHTSNNANSASANTGLGMNVGSSMNNTGLSTSSSTSSGNNSNTSTTDGSSNQITATDDVWNRLKTELTERLIVLFPKTGDMSNAAAPAGQVPALSGANMGMNAGTPNAIGQTASYYNKLSVGTVSINPETGAVTVQAPRYLMDELDKYMKKVIRRYNTQITFEGEIVALTTTANLSEGLDWSSFNTINNGNYTAIAQNNILGGAVITAATGGAIANSISIGNTAVPGANALFGIASATKKFAAINAYLGTLGQLRSKSTPIITTTSGSPVKLENTTVRHYQQYQQVAAAGGTLSGAAVATNTIDVPYETGMILRINPTYNVDTGVINALFSITRISKTGDEPKINPINSGTSVQLITTNTPIINSMTQNGNLTLKDGAFVVVGGLTDDTVDDSQSGIPGLMETSLSGLTGKAARNRTQTTYYFVLRVTLTDPNQPIKEVASLVPHTESHAPKEIPAAPAVEPSQVKDGKE